MYSLANITHVVKKNEMGEHVARMGNRRGAYRILVEKN